MRDAKKDRRPLEIASRQRVEENKKQKDVFERKKRNGLRKRDAANTGGLNELDPKAGSA